jgi:uncharacterized protein YjbI with pentapeptide repeats
MPRRRRRRSLEKSLAWFKGEPGHWAPSRDAEGRIWFPDHHAGIGRPDDLTDITFFRKGYRGGDFSDLTIPRRYMNRTSFEGVLFINTDLNQSFMCWNDFIDCDFTDADLTCCDMRSSIYRNCKFIRCKLIGANLQRSTFTGSDFTDADLTGVSVDDHSFDTLDLTEEQSQQIGDWEWIGLMPKGG